MDKQIFIEENQQFKIETYKDVKFIELNPIYSKTILSDVDLIIIDGDSTIFMEYKNSNIPGASNPESLNKKIKTDEHYIKIARKYYDSLIYISNCEKSNSSKKYYYILETEKMDSPLRKMIATKIKKKLPFGIEENQGVIYPLINDFHIISIKEWNELFSEYKFSSYEMKEKIIEGLQTPVSECIDENSVKC